MLFALCTPASAQTSPAREALPTAPSGPQTPSLGDDMPLSDYLGLLRQIGVVQPSLEVGSLIF